MELLYFTDISQLDYVLAEKHHCLVEMLPITGDLVVAFELERINIEFIDEWRYLTTDEIERNSEAAHNLSTSWWDERLVNTEYNGFPLSDVIQQDLIYPLEACLNARSIYGKILNLFEIETINGFFLPSVGVVRTQPSPVHRAVTSITQSVLIFMAEMRGISINRLSTDRPLSSGPIVKGGGW